MTQMLPNEVKTLLIKLSTKHALAKLAFGWIKRRKKARPTVDLYRMKRDLRETEGVSLTDASLAEYFEELQAAGLGVLTIKTLPDHNSFTFNHPVKYLIHVLPKAA